MIALLAAAALAWTGTLTVHYVNRGDDIDYSDVQRLSFSERPDGSRTISWKLVETRIGGDEVPAPADSTPQQIAVAPSLAWTPLGEDLQETITRLFAGLLRSQGSAFLWSYPAQTHGLPVGDLSVSPGRTGVEWTYAEIGPAHPVTAKGTAARNIRDGALEQLEGTIGSIRIPGGEAYVSVGLSYRRDR